MAMHANKPALPAGPLGGQPSPMTSLHRAVTSSPLPGMGQPNTPQAQGGNPYAQAVQGAGVGAPATAAGIMQAAQKTAEAPREGSLLSRMAVLSPGGRSPVAVDPALGDARHWVSDGSVVKNAHALEPRRPATGVSAPHTPGPVLQMRARSLFKAASMPMGPATAMPPAPPPPPMPTDAGQAGMLPPGAGTPPPTPGAAPPGGDPMAAGGAAPPQDPMAPQDPAAAGGQPPPTLDGTVPPMGMPPTPPLPANPRVNPPRQATPQDFQRRQDLNTLLSMDQQVQPENTAGDMQPDLLAMGSKSADSISAYWDSANLFDRLTAHFAAACKVADVEKQAAQDNGEDQHTLRRSSTGESKGLTYQHKPDHYAQGQDAWASVSGYFKGGEKKKPNPFIGKHAADGGGTSFSRILDSLGMAQLPDGTLQDVTRVRRSFTKAASCGDELAFKHYKSLGHSDEEADRLAGQPLSEQEKTAMNDWYANGGGGPTGKPRQRPAVDYGERLKRLRARRGEQPPEHDDIGSFSTTFKYAGDGARREGESREAWLARLALPQEQFKEAAAPFAGKSTMPIVKPGFSLKPTPPAAPYSPGAGKLKMKSNVLKPLPLPTRPASIGAGETPKLAEDMEKEAAMPKISFGKGWSPTWFNFLGGGAKAVPKVAPRVMPKVPPRTVPGAGFTMSNGPSMGSARPGTFAPPPAATPHPAMSAANVMVGGARAVNRNVIKPTMAALADPRMRSSIKRTGAGYVAGGFSGTPEEGEGVNVPWLGNVGFDHGRALMGAMAFNPALNRMAGRGNAMQRAVGVPMNAFRYNVAGSFAGSAADTVAGQMGFDTGGAGERWGGHLGTAAGLSRGVGNAVGRTPFPANGVGNIGHFAARAAQPAMTSMRRFGTNTGKAMGDFSRHALAPSWQAGTAPLRFMAQGVRAHAKPGGWVDNALGGMGVKALPTTARGWGANMFGNNAKSLPGFAGRMAGFGGLAGLGAGGVMHGLDAAKGHVKDTVQSAAVDTYKEMAPVIAGHATQVADQYLDSAGLLGPDGKVQAPPINFGGAAGQLGHGAMQMADQVFQRLGMDPSRMSTPQKISILGGMGLLGAGAATGNNTMMGLGGAGAAGGMAYGGQDSPLMQLLNRHQPRNEYMTQLQQTGQLPPNANPYGPSLQ